MSGRIARVRGLLTRRGWLDRAGPDGTYPLRLGQDRRARVAMTVTEAEFLLLIATPGLKARPGGGWAARGVEPDQAASTVGAPGRIEGERTVMMADGRAVRLSANLGQTPIAWLASRTDAEGRPFLTPAEVAAGERLRADAEMALVGPSLTMRWDALPRAGGGSAARVEPGDRAMAAARRVARALNACEPRTRAFVEQVCIRETPLQTAERWAAIPRREGKRVLKVGLQALAAHYGIG